MLDAEEREGSSRGRLDLLLEQLGADVVSETLEVELEALSGFQSGAAPVGGRRVGAQRCWAARGCQRVDGGQSVRLRGARDFDSRLAGNPRPFQSVRAAGLGGLPC